MEELNEVARILSEVGPNMFYVYLGYRLLENLFVLAIVGPLFYACYKLIVRMSKEVFE
jgi:hypothetical protein